MSKTTYKHLSEAEFERIKHILSIGGLKYGVVEQLTGRSYPIIKRVEECKTFAEYKQPIQRKEMVSNPQEEPTVYAQMIEVGNRLNELNREWTVLVQTVLQKTQV